MRRDICGAKRDDGKAAKESCGDPPAHAITGWAGSDASAQRSGWWSIVAKAVMQAASGNTAQITQMLQQIMQSTEGAALIGRINETLQK